MLYGHAAHSLLPYFVQICEILTSDRRYRYRCFLGAKIHIFRSCNKKVQICGKKQRHCFHAAKVRGKMIMGLVLFGTCFGKVGLDLFEEGIGFNFHSAKGKPFLTQVLQGCTEVINGVINAKETVVGVLELVNSNGLILRVMAL